MLDEVRDEMLRDAAQAVAHYGSPSPDVIDDDATLLVDVWVFNPEHTRTLLVRHPDRGWVMPGGKVERDEKPRAAAVRELGEETGLACISAALTPAASHYRVDPDTSPVWAMSYAIVVDESAALEGEPGQEPRWWDLTEQWTSRYTHDRARLLDYVRLRSQ